MESTDIEDCSVLMVGDAKIGKTQLFGQFDCVNSTLPSTNGENVARYIPTRGYLFGILHPWSVTVGTRDGHDRTCSVTLRIHEAGSSTQLSVFTAHEPLQHNAYLLCYNGLQPQSFVRMWEKWWLKVLGWIRKAQDSGYAKRRPFIVFVDLAHYANAEDASAKREEHSLVIRSVMPPHTYLCFNTPADSKDDARHLWSEISKQIVLQHSEASKSEPLVPPRVRPQASPRGWERLSYYIPSWFSRCFLPVSRTHSE